jgi:PAS domain-containing protein
MNVERERDSSADKAVIADLQARLREVEETLDAIRCGDVDAVLVNQAGSNQVFTLVNADRPYRSLIEQMEEGAVTLSEDGIVLYGNRRLGEILRAPLEQIVGSNIKRFFVGLEAAKFETLLAATGPEPSRAELRAGVADTHAVAVYISINDIVSEPGAPRLIGGVVTDLTQQHEIDDRFSHVRKMEAVGQLSGGLAHEFNNLFQAVCGNLDLIRLRPHDAGAVRKWADSGLRAADRGSSSTCSRWTWKAWCAAWPNCCEPPWGRRSSSSTNSNRQERGSWPRRPSSNWPSSTWPSTPGTPCLAVAACASPPPSARSARTRNSRRARTWS